MDSVQSRITTKKDNRQVFRKKGKNWWKKTSSKRTAEGKDIIAEIIRHTNFYSVYKLYSSMLQD